MAEAGEPEGQHAHSSVMTAIAELDKVFQPAQATPESVKRARSAVSRKTASVSTPALMSVLPPSRKRQRISWLAGEQLKEVRSPKQVYRPLSEDDLLERIATFTLTLWSDRKPEGCSVVDFARRGWRCTGRKREEVTCDVCQVTWQVSPASESRLDRDALEQDIAAKHGKSCPWRSKGCPGEHSHTRQARTLAKTSHSRAVSLTFVGAATTTSPRARRKSSVFSCRLPVRYEALTCATRLR